MKLTTTLCTIALASSVALGAAAAPGKGSAPERPAAAQGKRKPDPERIKQIRKRVLREKVGLSEEKARKVEQILDQADPERRKARGELREGRKALKDLLKADSNDQPAYEAALNRLQAAHKKLLDLRQQQQQALRKELTPKEQAKMLRALAQARRKLRQAARGRPADAPDADPYEE